MMGFSVLWCVRKGQTQFACPCCSTYDFLQAMSSQSPTMSTMGLNYSFLVPSRLSGLLWMPGETTVLLCTPPKQLRQGIPFSPSPQSLSPSPLMQQVLQEVLPKPRAWGDAQGTQPHAGVQRDHQQHRQLGSAESLGLIALSPLPTAPWLPTSRRDVLLCIMLVLRILLTSYITGECAQLPFAGSTRASPIQSTSINSNKDHLISRRQLVSSEVRLLC